VFCPVPTPRCRRRRSVNEKIGIPPPSSSQTRRARRLTAEDVPAFPPPEQPDHCRTKEPRHMWQNRHSRGAARDGPARPQDARDLSDKSASEPLPSGRSVRKPAILPGRDRETERLDGPTCRPNPRVQVTETHHRVGTEGRRTSGRRREATWGRGRQWASARRSREVG